VACFLWDRLQPVGDLRVEDPQLLSLALQLRDSSLKMDIPADARVFLNA